MLIHPITVFEADDHLLLADDRGRDGWLGLAPLGVTAKALRT